MKKEHAQAAICANIATIKEMASAILMEAATAAKEASEGNLNGAIGGISSVEKQIHALRPLYEAALTVHQIPTTD